jgi:hypothetical protein
MLAALIDADPVGLGAIRLNELDCKIAKLQKD